MDQLAFAPVTLYRPMRRFKSAIAQAVPIGLPFVPDGDFLVRLLTQHSGHQALLRAETGTGFKNLENLLRGRHQLSPTTLSNLSRQCQLSPDVLTGWVHGQADGPLAPTLLAMFGLFETIPGAWTAQVLATPVLCPCCGANMVADETLFWERQVLPFAPAEYAFAERLLRAAVGAAGMLHAIARLVGKTFDWGDVALLAEPGHYPIRNWLRIVQPHFKAQTLTALSKTMQTMQASECRVSYALLKKWSSGSEAMPVAVAQALTNGTGEPIRLWLLFLLARTVCFVMDFLQSATPVQPARRQIQKIVSCRIDGLIANMRMAIAMNNGAGR